VIYGFTNSAAEQRAVCARSVSVRVVWTTSSEARYRTQGSEHDERQTRI